MIQIVTSKTEPSDVGATSPNCAGPWGMETTATKDCGKGPWALNSTNLLGKILKVVFSNLSIPNDLMELLLKVINIHLRFSFHFGTIEGSLSYQPKQCTIKSKSLKMSVDVHQVLIPPNMGSIS